MVTTLKDLAGKKVALIGFGGANRSFYAALRSVHPELPVEVRDANRACTTPEHTHTTSRLGDDYLEDLESFDVLVRAPGVPYGEELSAVAERVTTATNLFFGTVHANTKARIIGVTGTKGKSTTSSLIHALLKAAGYDSLLVGNIDIQEWDLVDTIGDDTWIVYELSSYMLADFTDRPDIAVLTTAFPDHLNWHGNYDDYLHAKANIGAQQTEDDLMIFNATFEELVHIMSHSKAFKLPFKMMNGLHFDKAYFYDGGEELFATDAVPLPGRHYKDNLLAMLAVAKALKIDWSHAETVARTFEGLPHRLQNIGTYRDITFYDDALSTTPDSTIAAIEAFGDTLGSIILGGLDRGYDFGRLAQVLTDKQMPVVILFPGSRDKIKAALEASGYNGAVHTTESMKDAVALAFAETPKNTSCLLSTATPSFDLFKNYKDQGDQFQAAVREK